MADKKIFIDTDAGWDDWIALVILCNSTEVDVVGITVNGVGEAHINPGVQNIVDLLAYMGINTIPVYEGSKAPNSYSNVFPNSFRNSVDSFYGYDIPASGNAPSTMDPQEALKQAIDLYGDALEVVSIGGFTGLRNFMDYPGASAPLRITAMGGAVGVAGNIADLFAEAYPYNTTGEWNLFIDPLAADEVARASNGGFFDRTTIRYIPLDASYQVPLTQAVVDQYAGLTNNMGKFVYYVLNLKLQESISGGYGEYFYDPLAASTVIIPDQIIASGGIHNGTFTVTSDFPDEMKDELGTLIYTENATSKDEYVNAVNAQAYYDLMYAAVSTSA